MELIADRFSFDSSGSYRAGGLSRVYCGLDIATNQPVAVKLTDLDISKNGVTFRQETEVTEMLMNDPRAQIPYIVKVLHIREQEFDNRPKGIVVMEYVGGPLLKDFIRNNGPISEDAAMHWLKQLTKAVCVLQFFNVIHRDLKPDNVMLMSNSTDVKLIDFGCAICINNGQEDTRYGSECYAAPEVISGESYGKEVDIWGLGVLFLVMLNGLPLEKSIRAFVSEIDGIPHICPASKSLLKSMLAPAADRITHDELLRRLSIRIEPDQVSTGPVSRYRDNFTLRTVRARQISQTDLASSHMANFVSVIHKESLHFGRVLWPIDKIDQGSDSYFVFGEFDSTDIRELMDEELCLFDEAAKAIVQPLIEGLKDMHENQLALSEISPESVLIKNNDLREAWFGDFMKVQATTSDSLRNNLEAMGRLLAYLVTGLQAALTMPVYSLVTKLRGRQQWPSKQCIAFTCALLTSSSVSDLLGHEFLSPVVVPALLTPVSSLDYCTKLMREGERLAEGLLARREVYCYGSLLRVLCNCSSLLSTLLQQVRDYFPQEGSMAKYQERLKARTQQLEDWMTSFAPHQVAELRTPEESLYKHCKGVLSVKSDGSLKQEAAALAAFLCKGKFSRLVSSADLLRCNKLFNSLSSPLL